MKFGDPQAVFPPFNTSAAPSDGCALNDMVAVAVDDGSSHRVIVYDMIGKTILYDRTVSGAPTTQGMAFLSSTTVALANWVSDTTVRHVDLSSGTVTNLTGIDFSANNQKANQMACDIANNRAMFCAFTSGKLGRVDNSPAASTVTVTGMSGTVGNCIILKPGSANFIVGCNNGKLVEVDYTGATIQTVTLPTTPNSGSTPARIICNVSMSGNDLWVTTADNLIFHYDWSGPTLKGTYMWNGGGTVNSSGMLSPIVNGLMLLMCERISVQTAALWNVRQDPPMQTDEVVLGVTAPQCKFLYLSASGYGAMVQNNSLVSFGVTGLTAANVTTRAQDPPGTDISQRILRLPRPSIGRCLVELDASETAGSHSVNANFTEGEYYEASLSGSPSVSLGAIVGEKADLRRFTV